MTNPMETYEIRFDEHGHILIDDPALKQRLTAAILSAEGLRMRYTPDPEGGEVKAVPMLRCPEPGIEPPQPLPNMLCDPCTLIVADPRIYPIRAESGTKAP